MLKCALLTLTIIYYSWINQVSSITSISLDSSFTDDYESDANDAGIDGWTLEIQNEEYEDNYDFSVVEDENGNIRYHGWYNIKDTSYLYRYFDVVDVGYIQIEFTYIWACDIEPKIDNDYGDWMMIELGDDEPYEFWWSENEIAITDVSDTELELFESCSDDTLKGSKRTFTLTSTIFEPMDEYLVNFTSHLTLTDGALPWNEYYGIADIHISLIPFSTVDNICQGIDFADVTIEVCVYIMLFCLLY